jgi:hypothetical protein
MLNLYSGEVCICGLGEVLSPQITKKIWSANRKSAKSHICGRPANLTNYLNPQINRFAICGTYLRTIHLC